MRSLGTCFDVPPDPQVEHVITLLCQVFQTSSALLALVDSDRIYIRCCFRMLFVTKLYQRGSLNSFN